MGRSRPQHQGFLFHDLTAISLCLCLLLPFATATCYNRNGTDRNLYSANPDAYQPCPPTEYSKGEHHMCCAIGPGGADHCRPDGLCNSADGRLIWRESCTDKTWKDPACVQLCVDGVNEDGIQMKDTDQKILECPDTSFCCGVSDSAKNCCNNHSGKWIVNGLVTDVSPFSANSSSSTTSTSSSPTSSATTTATASTHSPSPTGKSKKLAGGAIAGIAIGALAGLALLLGAFLFFRRSRRSRPGSSSHPDAPAYDALPMDVKAEHENLPGTPGGAGHDQGPLAYPYSAQEIDGRLGAAGGKRVPEKTEPAPVAELGGS